MRYRDVIEALDAAGVRYVVVGGVAMVLRGCQRETADLDLVVDAAPGPAERVMGALLGAGFVPTLPLGLGEVSVLRLLDAGGREVDLFARFEIPFEELWAGSGLVTTDGMAVRVACVAHLADQKRRSARESDQRDAEMLEALGSRD
jgi:hypothetical protein